MSLRQTPPPLPACTPPGSARRLSTAWRRVAALCATPLLALALAAPPAHAAGPAAATELLCSARTGEETATLRVPAGRDAWAPAVAAVGERFELRVQALADGADTQQVGRVVVTVVDTDEPQRPQVLAQGRWSTVGQPALDAAAPWQPVLTGWQRSYSPALGRELAWGCAVVQAGATPAGWTDADATQPLPPQPAAARAAADAGQRTDTRTVRLAWMGDVMLADGPGRVIARGQDPFAAMAADLKQADLRIANLECVIADNGRALRKPWTFRAHPRTLKVLQRHVDAVSLANNHSGDYGPQAFAQMLGRLQQAGLPHFGGGDNQRQAHQPLILQRNGLRIALLGYNEMFPREFEAGPRRPGIAWANDEQIVAAIQAARQQADVVIPYVHWGQEHSTTAHARQRALARLMIAAGADAVVGTHPHVRQDTELIDGKPVIYSLGNFVFDGFSDAENNTGSLLWMTVGARGVVDWRLQTVRIDPEGRPHPGR